MSTLLLPANVSDTEEPLVNNESSNLASLPEELTTLASAELSVSPAVKDQLEDAIQVASQLGIEVKPDEIVVDFLVVDATQELNFATWKMPGSARLIFSIVPEDPTKPSSMLIQQYTVQRFDARGDLLTQDLHTYIPEEEFDLYESMQRIDDGTKKLSRRGPHGHAVAFGRSVSEVFPRGKNVTVVGDPFLVMADSFSSLGCESMTIVEYAPEEEIATPLYRMLDPQSHWRSWGYSALENIEKWLNANYEYDLMALHAQGYSDGVGLNYDHLVPEYDHRSTENINQGTVYNALYGAYADMCNMVTEIDSVSSAGQISDIVNNYRSRFEGLKGRYDSGFYAGERSAVEHIHHYVSRNEAFSGLVEQARTDWTIVSEELGLDTSSLPQIEETIKELEALGPNARAGVRLGRRLEQETWKLLQKFEEEFPKEKEERSNRYIHLEYFHTGVSFIRGLNNRDREERLAETFLTRYEQHLTYFESIYPHLIQDRERMEKAGVPAGTIRKVLTTNEEVAWKEQFKISQKNGVAIVHGYFPKINVAPNSQDAIVSVYAHTVHGWNALESLEEMENELHENIKFLKPGGKMFAGPINHKKLVALQREYDNTSDNLGIAFLLADALEKMHAEGEIEFEVVYPNSMKKEDKDYGPNSTQFLRDHGFANGIIVKRLK